MLRRSFVRSPVRIDIAGGTLDIWPIFLQIRGAKTINISANIFTHAECIIEPSPKAPTIFLESVDLKKTASIPLTDFSGFDPPPELVLHKKILDYYLSIGKFNQQSITIKTKSESPSGAGLGGSSSLGISIASGLEALIDPQIKSFSDKLKWKIIQLVRDIECSVLKGPAGMQDYFGAAFGGLQTIYWNPVQPIRIRHKESENSLSERMFIFYSGISRNSGINNWEVFKSFLDGDATIQKLFNGISKATEQLEYAIRENDSTKIASAITAEWGSRKNLSKNISTPEIDAAFDFGTKLGADAYKICGAGGGGCFFFYFKNPDKTNISKLIEGLESLGMKYLPQSCVPEGTQILDQREKNL